MEEKLEFNVNPYHVEKMLDHYRDMLLVKYPRRFLTPAFMLEMQMALDDYRAKMMKRENNEVWRMPVKVIGDARTNNIDVTLADNVTVKV